MFYIPRRIVIKLLYDGNVRVRRIITNYPLASNVKVLSQVGEKKSYVEQVS